MDIFINVHLNQELYFLEEMIHDIVDWLKDDTFRLINKMNYVTTWAKSVITAQEYGNKGQNLFDQATFKASDSYMSMFCFLTFFF